MIRLVTVFFSFMLIPQAFSDSTQVENDLESVTEIQVTSVNCSVSYKIHPFKPAIVQPAPPYCIISTTAKPEDTTSEHESTSDSETTTTSSPMTTTTTTTTPTDPTTIKTTTESPTTPKIWWSWLPWSTTTRAPYWIVTRPTTTYRPYVPYVASVPAKPSKPESSIGYDSQCGVQGNPPVRIVGGGNALPGEFPWQISLQLSTGASSRHICGGAVISSHWVVTAAHCVYGISPRQLSIVAGDHNLFAVEGNEQRSTVVRIVGRNYVKDNFTDDIALLQVSPPLRFNRWVSPICLPDSRSRFTTGYGEVSGWGRLRETGGVPPVLQYVKLPLVDKATCWRLFRNAGYNSYLNTCQLCAGYEHGGKDSCQGDSGGPLACFKQSEGRYYLCGVVSWGVGCARPSFPGVYTEVTCYSDWIKNILYNRTPLPSIASNLL